jgi:amino acid adenylation domain-containing protein
MRRLLVDYNATQAEYPKDKCLHQLFVEQVARDGEKTAVVCGEERLTYRELHERSQNLALYLQSRGVRPDRLVGLCMDRSLDMMVGLLGILQAGGAYVPLDPSYPDERLAYMLRDSRAAIVLTRGKLEEKLSGLVPAGTPLIALDRQWSEIDDRVAELRAANVRLQEKVRSHHLAYVIYTSGSTGQPKGVAIEHRALTNLLAAMKQRPGIASDDVMLALATFSFDMAVPELYLPLITGARVVLASREAAADPEQLAALVRRHGVSVMQATPSTWRMLLGQDWSDFSSSLKVLCGAEPLPSDLARALLDRVPAIWNMYGPTETTVWSTAHCVTTADTPPPIGRPIANTQIYILDSYGKSVPVGAPGELHIAGDGLARGYLNRPELTQEKFVANSFAPGTRMYKTGDLARWLDDGAIQYLGRIDAQVKIRGFRIELGEIEARLNQHPGIKDSAVVAQGQGADKRLIAFYRAKGATADQIVQLPNEELRAHLLRTLPDYMAPAAFVSLAAIPLNPNGKVDRRALARMDVTMASGETYVAPRDETEQRLAVIWAEVLNVEPERIGVNDNFFELGGHSLSAVQLMAKTNRHFKQMLPLAVLFTAPNIAAFAKLISSEGSPSFDILVPIQTDGDAPPVFAVPGVGGNVLSLQPLSKALGAKQPFYGLQAVGLDGKTPPFGSVEQTAQANIAALKTVQPGGPYRLIGHSYGGVVAYEMARILLEQGEGISSLILLDSIAPSVMQGEPANDEATDLFEACATMANIYGADLKIDLNRLRQSSSEENVQYIVSLLNDHGLEINDRQFAAFQRVFRANQVCYRAYKPPTLSHKIDVSLYRATQGRQDGPTMPRDYGWNQLLQIPIRVYDVEANHFSILEKARLQ